MRTECFVRVQNVVCSYKGVLYAYIIFYLRTKSFLRVQNSLYTYTSLYEYNKLCTRPYLGGGYSILFHQYDIVNICED